MIWSLDGRKKDLIQFCSRTYLQKFSILLALFLDNLIQLKLNRVQLFDRHRFASKNSEGWGALKYPQLAWGMLAFSKLVDAQTREEAIDKMKRALDEFVIEGIKTTIPFHRKLMDSQAYLEGNYTTKFMEDFSMED